MSYSLRFGLVCDGGHTSATGGPHSEGSLPPPCGRMISSSIRSRPAQRPVRLGDTGHMTNHARSSTIGPLLEDQIYGHSCAIRDENHAHPPWGRGTPDSMAVRGPFRL